MKNKSIMISTVKPRHAPVSILMGVSSGIEPVFQEYYIRRIKDCSYKSLDSDDQKSE